MVTFAAGSGPGAISTPSCDIIIINDLLLEQDETYSLGGNLINTSGQVAQFTAGGESASATIIDDDGRLVCTFRKTKLGCSHPVVYLMLVLCDRFLFQTSYCSLYV